MKENQESKQERIQMRIEPSRKSEWERQAKDNNQTLSSWVIYRVEQQNN